MGVLVKSCDKCGHHHSRLRRYCLTPRCVCPPIPEWRKSRLLCGHNAREQTVTPTRGNGWTGTVTETRCLDCGKDLR